LSNNGTKISQQKRVIVHKITYKYKAMQLIEKANVNLKNATLAMNR